MFVFCNFWRALPSCYLRFEIRPFALLPTNYSRSLPSHAATNGAYSSLPNRRDARNKRGGGKDEPFLISVVPGISIVVRIFRPVTAIKRRKKNELNF